MENLKLFFDQLLPLVLVMMVIALIVVLVYIVILLSKLHKTADELNVALNDVNKKLVDLNPTIQTVKTISNSVDTGFKAGGHAISSTIGRAKGTVSTLRHTLKNLKNKGGK